MFRSELLKDASLASDGGLGEFNLAEFDAEMTGLNESISMFTKSDGSSFCLGISPTHSTDSGVDNIEEDMFDFENSSSYSENWWGDLPEDSCASYTLPDTIPSRKEEKSPLIRSRKCRLEEVIDEDHCYTSKEILTSSGQTNGPMAAMSATADVKNKYSSGHALLKTTEKTNDLMMMQGMDSKECNEKGGKIFEKISVEDASDRCNNRNAVMARLNRQRKKRYISNLESEVSTLRQRNTSLLAENRDLKVSMSKCREELAYLRNVLENQSMLANVIKAVSSVPSVNLKGVVNTSGKRHEDENRAVNDLHRANSPMDTISNPSGVCLHVQKENVSIEFCHHCSSHARSDQ